jgi:hypothetical protein
MTIRFEKAKSLNTNLIYTQFIYSNRNVSNIAFIYQMITANYIWKHLVFAYPKRNATISVVSVLKWSSVDSVIWRAISKQRLLIYMSCSSALPSAHQKSVFAYPKQRATVLVGSVLKWRARPQCLRRQKSVFAYPKQRATFSVESVLKWRARPQCLRRRRDFVLQMNNTIVPFSFGISENKVFSNVIDSYHLVDERYIQGEHLNFERYVPIGKTFFVIVRLWKIKF